MLTKKKKLTRKEIKQDKLVEFYYKSQNFFEENKNKILMYAGAVAVVIIGIILYTNYRSDQNEEAGTHLAKVMDLYDMGAHLEAIEGVQNKNIIGLEKIVQNYGSTENGEIAKIYLANSYASFGKTDEALKYYEDYSGDIDIFKSAAFAGRAGIKSANGNFKEAAELYVKASKVSKTNVLNPDYLLQASLNFIEAGDKDEAKSLLQIIKEQYKTSTANVQADRYLSMLN